MPECCPKKNNSLKINLGNFISIKSLKKTLWSISSYINIEDKPEVILTTHLNEVDIVNILDTFNTRLNYTLIKTNDSQLSDDKAYEVCNKFCDNLVLKLSCNVLFYKTLKLDKPCSFNSFLLPKYVQEGIEEYGQNMCEYYAKECMKHPINNVFYYISNDDLSEVNIFCIEEDRQEEPFSELSVDEIIHASKIIRK